jgi:HEAT repeat protein
LQHDTDVAGRLEAVELLHADPAVANAARNDPDWGVRAAAAAELTDAKSLVAMLHDRDSRVRSASAKALAVAGLSGQDVIVSLKEVVSGDSSLFVRGTALVALARLDTTAALPMIRSMLTMDSWTDVERSAALRALALTHSPDAFTLASHFVAPTASRFARLAAIETLVASGRETSLKDSVAKELSPDLDDPDLFVREAVARSLGALAVPSSAPALESRKRVEASGFVLTAIDDALTAIRSGKQ